MPQKRPWKPSMGLVPSSHAGSMPPRPGSVAGEHRLARQGTTQLQPPSQARMTMSQPNSFQEYAVCGTPDRQYMLPANDRQPQHSAAYNMPSSQPSSGQERTHVQLPALLREAYTCSSVSEHDKRGHAAQMCWLI